MTSERFLFQQMCATKLDGIVLNVGSNEDPAGLRDLLGSRCINCDIEVFDGGMLRPNVVDKIFDMRETWPFPDDYAALVVLGDVLECLLETEISFVLGEAKRVGRNLCVTVPEDDRFIREGHGVGTRDSGARSHCTVVTRNRLEGWLAAARWDVKVIEEVDYNFVPRGYFVLANGRAAALA